MELLKLSKFKLQLQSMIGEVRDLRVRRKRFIHLWIVYFFAPLFLSSSSSSYFTIGVFWQGRERSVTDHINLVNQVLQSTLLYMALDFVAISES